MTLFGISEKKKRGIVVPVMALVVCSVAMVGLGFALETSVTSSSNAVQSLMVDLDDHASDLGEQNGKPDSDKVDGLFSIGISTTKQDVNSGNPVQTTITGGKAYLEVFGNVDSIDIFVIGNSLPSGVSVSFAIYTVSGENKSSANGVATISADDSEATEFNGTYASSTVYWVEITSITSNGKTIGFTHNNGGVSISDDDVSELNEIAELNLSFTFSSKPKA